MATIVPMLAYADAQSAIDFLCRAFGFKETMRMDGDNGTIAHAELALDGATVSLASVWRDGGFSTPAELGGNHSQIWCEVDDIDAHFEHARAAGAIVVGPPADQEYGYRTYRAVDPEGHRWYFAAPRPDRAGS
ncbi:MAG TPA: VOC family protein [Acidimicrobiia bacterium]|nr:VOC family protein [Acidimicrobiia bacterium]